jgi:hypothetical protein
VKKALDVYDLPHHPAAALFPMMGEAELQELANVIKANKQLDQVVILDDQILDGRNRLAACKLAGVRPNCQHYKSEKSEGGRFYHGGTYWTPTDFVLTKNLYRRHLTAEQKREVIAKVLKENPGRSNRQVAEQVKADHKTVGTVRERLESTGEIPQLDETQGKDGKARPVKKKQDPRKGRSRKIMEDKVRSMVEQLADAPDPPLREEARRSSPSGKHFVNTEEIHAFHARVKELVAESGEMTGLKKMVEGWTNEARWEFCDDIEALARKLRCWSIGLRDHGKADA